MNENFSDRFKEYQPGDILDIYWDRGNGELYRKNFFYGIDTFNGVPLLVDIGNFERKPVVFFDASNPEITITKIEKVLSL
ncbi:hypothetical protein HYT25_03675 [Candidatus Pacearchaeota archaeon]|nr:hypothetical protein [Candidatus Pacearchaeota archaeon]